MEQLNLDRFAKLALEMTDVAAAIACDRFHSVATRYKPDGTELTEADMAIQRMMLDRIQRSCPDHMVLGEESGMSGGSPDEAATAEFCWVTDPLDGTRNFSRGVPVFSSAVALLCRGEPVVGVVRCLTTRDAYVALRGGGAWYEKKRLRATASPQDVRAMVAVQSTIRGNDSRIVDALSGTAALRNLGSTALHMAMVAAGGFAGAVAWECRLWDVAAGWLLVQEAGGLCTDWTGRPLVPFRRDAFAGSEVPFIAAGPETHGQFVQRMQGLNDIPKRA